MVGSPILKIALAFTLTWEGGYVNHPADPGGETNRGITSSVYHHYLRRKGEPIRSVMLITDSEVLEIYQQEYWNRLHPERFSSVRLAVVMFDTAVNFGVSGAIMFLQEALGGLAVDGIWGQKTDNAFKACNQSNLARRIVDNRQSYRYRRAREHPPSQAFLQGWLNRDRALQKFIEKLPP